MKRFIAAASLALVTSSAFAAQIGKPFEQLDVDRALPDIAQAEASATVYPFNGSAPYDQVAVDRTLPNIAVTTERPTTERAQLAASAGETRTDAVNAAEEKPAVSPFAEQHDFVAPAP
jgi:hypothetical protein